MPRDRRLIRAAGWLAFGLAQVSLHVWRSHLAELYAAFMMLTVTGGAAVHAVAAWRAFGRARVVWTTTTVALTCWGYAELSVGVPTLMSGVTPVRTLAANLLNLFALSLTVVAMLTIPSAPKDRLIRLRMVLDGTVAASALAGVVWMLVLAPMMRREGLHQAFFDLAYPVLAAGVLTVALVLLAGQPVRRRTAMTWVTSGVLVLTMGLLVEVLGNVSHQGWILPWTRNAYLTAAVLLGLAARAPLPSARERVWRPADAGLTPYIPVAGLCAAVMICTALGRLLDPEVVWSAMIMVAALMVRQLLTLRNNAALTEDLQNQQARLAVEAAQDALTGLPNRSAFNAALAASGSREDLALLMIDLDGFKAVNDTLGHAAGDQLLVTVAERIRDSVSGFGPAALPSRLGGDEFAVLLHGPLDAATRLAGNLVVALSTPMSLEGRPAMVGASVGIAGTVFGRDRGRLLRDADLALYEAKSRGKGHYRVFDERMSALVEARQTLEIELAGAIGGHQLRLHYQPIVDLETGRARKAEALLRWEHPVRGLVGPDEFVPPAQEAGLLPSFDRWALSAAAAQVARWRETEPEFAVTVNASAGYLASGGLLADVRRALAEHELPGQAILIEVTENTLVANLDLAARTLADLQELGVRIALDDFGVGYSSLTYLRTLPVDVVKIDRSFVRDLDQQDPDAVFLIDTVITLTRRLGLDCVAEGIETPVQAARLRALGCKQGQGFFFARPVPAESTPPRAVGGVRVRG